MDFTHTLRVRYAEVDAQGVVFNAHWLTYADEAMTSFFEQLGYPPKETWTQAHAGGPSTGGEKSGQPPFDVMLKRSEIEWSGPARFADLVEIEVEPVRLGTSSMELEFTARVEGAEVARIVTTYVFVAPGEGRSTPIPDHVRAKLSG